LAEIDNIDEIVKNIDEIVKAFENDEDYKKIKMELDPFLTEILHVTGKTELKFQAFKTNMLKWRDELNKVSAIAGKILSLQLQQSKISETGQKKQNTIIDMFVYLGLVESIGAMIIDFAILLLIAYGVDFHVERTHDFPRIIHAETFEDLQSSNISLTSKINFLERHRLEMTAKIVNTDLRNKIAHLNLTSNDLDKEGELSENFLKNIQDKTHTLNLTSMFIISILLEYKIWEKLGLAS